MVDKDKVNDNDCGMYSISISTPCRNVIDATKYDILPSVDPPCLSLDES